MISYITLISFDLYKVVFINYICELFYILFFSLKIDIINILDTISNYIFISNKLETWLVKHKAQDLTNCKYSSI